jgi:hypothetical protein
VDHVVVGLALPLRLGGALGDERDERADAREQAVGGRMGFDGGDGAPR